MKKNERELELEMVREAIVPLAEVCALSGEKRFVWVSTVLFCLAGAIEIEDTQSLEELAKVCKAFAKRELKFLKDDKIPSC